MDMDIDFDWAGDGAGSSAVDDPCTTDRRRHRIEALRAASRIAAPVYAANKLKGDVGVSEWALGMAEQFALWLETGKR